MRGDSEKQIALVLCISRNTVHVYVTKLYRYFAVQSRVELLGRFFAIFVEEVQCRDRQEKENAAVKSKSLPVGRSDFETTLSLPSGVKENRTEIDGWGIPPPIVRA